MLKSFLVIPLGLLLGSAVFNAVKACLWQSEKWKKKKNSCGLLKGITKLEKNV